MPGENCIQVCGWWCCFLNDPSALITAYGMFVAILGFWFISVQVEQGHKGLKQTKRSVDIAIAQERPCLLVQSFNYYCPSGDTTAMAFYELKNCGRTVGVIMRLGFTTEISPYKVRDVVELDYSKDTVMEYRVLLPGEVYTARMYATVGAHQTEQLKTANGLGREIVTQAMIVYRDSAGNMYRHRFTAYAAQITYSDEEGDRYEATIDARKGHWEDGPWDVPSEIVDYVHPEGPRFSK